MQPRLGQQRLALRHLTDQIDHAGMTACVGGPEREPSYGAHVVLELAGHGPFDGPVTRVVDPGGHFIRDQAPLVHEEFDGQNADIEKSLQHALEARSGSAQQLRGVPGREREAQYAVGVIVAIERVDRDLAAAAAYADDRDFIVEGHELLVEQWHAAELLPRALAILRPAQHILSLAVIAESPRLEHAGQTNALDGTL